MSDSGHATTSSESRTPAPTPQRRRPIPRKGHTKSRAGCPNCKRRKVKCDEVRPECGPCRRLGLGCDYAKRSSGIRDVARSPSPPSTSSTASLTRSLTTQPGLFDMADLQFFHHFMASAYPPLPIGGWAVWQRVSQLSHEYDFLAHSMLGLGASHLSLLSPGRYTQAALRHRVIAIKRLNESLSRPSCSVADTDAAFAAILALTYQAAHMPDGLVDFFAMTRGCFLLGSKMEPNINASAFKAFERDTYVDSVVQLAATGGPLQILDREFASQFCASLEQLGPLCRSVAEVDYLATMRGTVLSVFSDIVESYRLHSTLYEKLVLLRVEEFNAFIDPHNHVSRLVIAHMLLLDCIMSIGTADVDGQPPGLFSMKRRYDTRNAMTCIWIQKIATSLPARYRPFADFPVKFANILMSLFEADTSFWKPLLLEEGEAARPELLCIDSSDDP